MFYGLVKLIITFCSQLTLPALREFSSFEQYKREKYFEHKNMLIINVKTFKCNKNKGK